MEERNEDLAQELGKETNGEHAIDTPEQEEPVKFHVIGLQVGMRRMVIRPETLTSVLVTVGEIKTYCYSAEVVDPAVVEGEAPSMMKVLIPYDQVQMLITEEKDEAEAEVAAVDDEEDVAALRDRGQELEEDTVDENDGAVADRMGAVG